MGMVEQEYADSFVHDRWEIERYREISAGVLNNAFVEALENVLKQALPRDKYESQPRRRRSRASLFPG